MNGGRGLHITLPPWTGIVLVPAVLLALPFIVLFVAINVVLEVLDEAFKKKA